MITFVGTVAERPPASEQLTRTVTEFRTVSDVVLDRMRASLTASVERAPVTQPDRP
jgi:hypothetical protein